MCYYINESSVTDVYALKIWWEEILKKYSNLMYILKKLFYKSKIQFGQIQYI